MNVQPDLIAGIYNYCDTWCERCLFTARCRSFQIQSETGLAKTMDAGGNLVQQLTDALTLTKQYIDNLTRAQGNDVLNAPTEEQTQTLEQKAVQREDTAARPIRQHSATMLANDYLRQTGIWMKEEKDFLEQAGQQQLHEVELGLRTQEEAMPTLHALKDAWEMIRWYRTLIPVKTQSALRALAEPTENMRLVNYHLGKAKLVLVSIDRSLLAWQTVMQHYPEKTDALLDLLSLLSRLRRELETVFPDARAFQRPGLD
ncbi:hypothetical protein HNV11_21570 [Spirosoma taeanense]|uniref:Uncharacterized protein n=1 Tax=Spirosoma taeanense TaxID=2735870 RepID=A0A6M5YFI3_9BACT|nr:hypothetical protein [Spirosoma taeanense]QJW91782.1 hypothetical protein HNV11_21570 [Spirosoma taeanense]